ncbi:MAG: GFA family protein [Lentisphaerae bacterium]|nr:GFA family protein [Lentisphaerota bacterium]
MSTLTGGCHCGGVRYELTGAIQRFAYCHCDDCRKIGGAAYAAALVADAAGFTITSGESLLTPYPSSPGKYRRFCRVCGSHVYATMEQRPNIVIVRAGTLDAPPADLRPQMHIWVDAKAPWYDIHDDLPQFPQGFVAR